MSFTESNKWYVNVCARSNLFPHITIYISTMSGRRLRNSVKKVLLENGFPSNVTIVIAGLSNTYSDYVTTFEEYQVFFSPTTQ